MAPFGRRTFMAGVVVLCVAIGVALVSRNGLEPANWSIDFPAPQAENKKSGGAAAIPEKPVKKTEAPVASTPSTETGPLPAEATGDDKASDCVDSDASCPTWAAAGECESNKDFMNLNCKAACGACGGGTPETAPAAEVAAAEPAAEATPATGCADESPSCGEWAAAGECESNKDYMNKACAVACNTCGAKPAE